MDIFEKLRITPETVCYKETWIKKYNTQGEPDIEYVKWLEERYCEMREALIDYIKKDEEHRSKFGSGLLSVVKRNEYILIIASTTGKTWEEIKSLLEN